MEVSKLLKLSYQTLNAAQITCLPIDPHEVAARIGIETKFIMSDEEKKHFFSANAYLRFYQGSYYICYNGKATNLEVAHEIAHYLLRHTMDGNSEEEDANLLGQLLLAPPHIIHRLGFKESWQISAACDISIENTDSYIKILKSIDLKPEKILDENFSEFYKDFKKIRRKINFNFFITKILSLNVKLNGDWYIAKKLNSTIRTYQEKILKEGLRKMKDERTKR